VFSGRNISAAGAASLGDSTSLGHTEHVLSRRVLCSLGDSTSLGHTEHVLSRRVLCSLGDSTSLGHTEHVLSRSVLCSLRDSTSMGSGSSFRFLGLLLICTTFKGAPFDIYYL